MNGKLTLTIEKELIDNAREYAKEKGETLSDMIENYLKLVTVERRKMKEVELSPRVRKLRGIVKVDEDSSYDKLLVQALSEKYGA